MIVIVNIVRYGFRSARTAVRFNDHRDVLNIIQQGLQKIFMARDLTSQYLFIVILAYAGIHNSVRNRLMDSRLRGNDVYSGQ